MPATEPTIIATSIGFNRANQGPMDWRLGPIFPFAVELSGAISGTFLRALAGTGAPKLCFLSTADGDRPETITAVYAAFAGSGISASHLSLFPMPNHADIRAHLLNQDIIWVLGGSVVNLLAVWRAHNLPQILHECWQKGVVLGGVSAGSVCWHAGGTTDSFGPTLQPVTDALGWLPYSNGVHYDAEPERRPLMHKLIGEGTLGNGYATDNGAALVYRGTRLAEVVTDRPAAGAYAVSRNEDGSIHERPLTVRLLPGRS